MEITGTLGQVAYQAARDERLSRRPSDEVILWGELNEVTRSMWEAAATAVVLSRVNRVSEATEDLVWLSHWIDDSPANVNRDTEAKLWGRVSKIGEEFGEVVAAMIGATGQNPRKGVTHDLSDVRKELLDVAVTALGAIEHIDEHQGQSIGDLLVFIGKVRARAESLIRHPANTPNSLPLGTNHILVPAEGLSRSAEETRQSIINNHHDYGFHGMCRHGELRGDCTNGGY